MFLDLALGSGTIESAFGLETYCMAKGMHVSYMEELGRIGPKGKTYSDYFISGLKEPIRSNDIKRLKKLIDSERDLIH